MTRYFYRSPLVAALMIEMHGMRYDSPLHIRLDASTEEGIVKQSVTITCNAGGKLYLHPDSLHLLEPRDGDLIRWHNPTAWDSHQHRFTLLDSPRPIHPDNRLLSIIQRNGKPFFWPEVEQ